MSDLKLESGIEGDIQRAQVLTDYLPTFMPKHKDTKNYQTYGAVAEEIDDTDEEIEVVQRAVLLNKAESIDDLKNHGKMVNVLPEENEGLEHYRIRVMASFLNITSEGTIRDILESAAYILDIPISRISYKEASEPGLIIIGLPVGAVDEIPLSAGDVTNLIDQNIAAGYTLQALSTGTFGYITPTAYNNNNHDANAGYTSLDNNGNIKDGGGTYSTTY